MDMLLWEHVPKMCTSCTLHPQKSSKLDRRGRWLPREMRHWLCLIVPHDRCDSQVTTHADNPNDNAMLYRGRQTATCSLFSSAVWKSLVPHASDSIEWYYWEVLPCRGREGWFLKHSHTQTAPAHCLIQVFVGRALFLVGIVAGKNNTASC